MHHFSAPDDIHCHCLEEASTCRDVLTPVPTSPGPATHLLHSIRALLARVRPRRPLVPHRPAGRRAVFVLAAGLALGAGAGDTTAVAGPAPRSPHRAVDPVGGVHVFAPAAWPARVPHPRPH